MQACGWLRVAVVALFWVAAAAFAQDATLDRARKLLEAKQAKEAYALLAPLEQQRAGEVEFDYLLGVAAIDAGELTRGVFALERVLAVRPDHPQARAEIARAYFLMGENKTAREEFEAVKRGKPPAEVAVTIDQFLNALDARERARRTGVVGYLEASVGYDTNANAATSSSSFAIPLFPGFTFTLAPTAAKQSDDFWSFAGGVVGRYAINDTWGLVGNASFDQRRNDEASLNQFDTGSYNASGGVTYTVDANEFLGAAQWQQYYVGHQRFRDAAGVVGQWKRTVTLNDQVTVYGQYTRLGYPGQSLRNADRKVLGGAWAHAYGTPRTASFAGLYVGEEDERAQNVPQFGHRLWGARVGGQIGYGDKWTLSASASYEQRRYGGPDPFFLVDRHDREFQARAAANYAIDRNWSVTPALAYTDNRSNIVVNDYERFILSVTVRYEFR
jgi:tetratricopeptide (TPR) repeat protein